MSNSSFSLSELTQSIFSYNSNLMLAALISLLLVVLFVLLLHAYAKCFFPQPRRSSVRVSYILNSSSFSDFDSVPYEFSLPTKLGLEPSAIAAIPLFVFEEREIGRIECVICLSEFEEREIGRRLTKCGHCFHLECIDMWLNSHRNCPICRAPAKSETIAAESGVEIVIDEQSSENERNQRQNGESLTASSSSSSSSSSTFDSALLSIGISLKRILSRNKSEGRIFPNGVELDV